MLKQKDLKRVTLIQACIKGECTVKQVANALGISERRVKQIKKEVKELGKRGCNRGRRYSSRNTTKYKFQSRT